MKTRSSDSEGAVLNSFSLVLYQLSSKTLDVVDVVDVDVVICFVVGHTLCCLAQVPKILTTLKQQSR